MKYKNMKRYRNILAMAAMVIASGFLSASCSSEDANEEKAEVSKSPLKIHVAGVATTKSFYEDTKLPDECEYSIFIKNDGIEYYDIPVKYVKGESYISRNIYITRESSVGAVYCDRKKVAIDGDFIMLNPSGQQDVLVAFSWVTPSNPQVSLMFKHIMSRVALRIFKTPENNRIYEFGTAVVDGLTHGDYCLFYDTVELLDKSTSIKLEPKEKSYIETETDVVEYDFLTVPQYASDLKFDISGSLTTVLTLPQTYLKAGNKYVFNAVLTGNNLEIQSVEVEPWTSEEHDISIEI